MKKKFNLRVEWTQQNNIGPVNTGVQIEKKMDMEDTPCRIHSKV
jgi:hypothetical protein